MYRFLNERLEIFANEGIVKSPRFIYSIAKASNIGNWLWVFLLSFLVFSFLPWTQNIRSKGYVTTVNQQDRPQQVNAIIPGKVERWMVKEGDFVKKGDVILQLGEVKVEYFDPKLIERTQQQIEAKNQSGLSYTNKANTSDLQISALVRSQLYKLQSIENKIGQQKLKISSDSADKVAVVNANSAYKRQFVAAKILLDSGAISLSEFEKRRIVNQEAAAKLTSIENKLNQSKQELLNLQIEKNVAVQDYQEKIAKAEGDRFASLSNVASNSADVLKLENQLANYDARNQLFMIKASQDGQIIKVKNAGLGEMIKEGEFIAEIVPIRSQKAIEMYVEPVDLPLLNVGQEVRFVFDGFPAIVFSGWPEGSFGTFGGQIFAIESAVSSNGKFRVLVSENPKEKAWPKGLKIGGGANGIALLKNVPVYYELWRNINGFPPDFYTIDKSEKK
jgi:multidrug resistance efflux pump